jgi:ubiquinone/menaquinone biosynthesis C-methylase UbiE
MEEGGVVLREGEGELSYHPGMARLRLKRLDAGDRDDALCTVAEIAPGEKVLDATLGLGQDALVAARLVGPAGRVVALEKSFALWVVTSEGLAHAKPDELACRVECLNVDAREYLAAQPDGAFDCVLFDPMFERPRKAQPSFEVLRRFADHSPLTPEVLKEAKRVARRCVAVKASPYSKDLSKLGLSPFRARRDPRVLWARVEGLGRGP